MSVRPLVIDNVLVVDPSQWPSQGPSQGLSQGLSQSGRVIVADGVILAAGPDAAAMTPPAEAEVIDGAGKAVIPGLIDMRVFVGEPGFEHKETFASASSAAAAGGITTLITQPDTDPIIDDPSLVDFTLRRARDTARVRVAPMAALTKGQTGEVMTEFGLLREAGAVAFSSGRTAVANAQVLRRALTYARNFDALVVHFPEDPNLKGSGVMHAGMTSVGLGLADIPAEAETTMLARDLRLARLSHGRYHAALVSTAESVDLIRWAKGQGIRVSAGVAVANLCLNDFDVVGYRTFFKLSPPLRSEDDRKALIAGVADGTIDVIVSNHDPQDSEMKRMPFAEAADGAIGLETLLAAGLRLVHNGDLPLIRLIEALSTAPARLLGLKHGAGTLAVGAQADLALVDLAAPWIYSEAEIRSRAKNTCFEGARFQGRVLATWVGGERVFQQE